MSIRSTIAALKALGCKARYSTEWQEYRVTLPGLPADREEAIAYYTSDPADALDTGRAMTGKARAQRHWLEREEADALDLY